MVSMDSECTSTRQAECQETEMSKCTRVEIGVFVKILATAEDCSQNAEMGVES